MKLRASKSRVRSSAIGRTRRPAVVAPCRCAGTCRCSDRVPTLILAEIERECEFFRSVM